MVTVRSAECVVEVDPPGPRGFYTSGDTVNGKVKVDVHRDLHVASIEIQMKCEDRGRVLNSKGEEANYSVPDLSAVHFDDMKTLWESPSIDLELPETGVLNRGTHEFTFQFELPTETDRLPGSFSVEAHHLYNGVYWGVHLTIDRESRARANFHELGLTNVQPLRIKKASPQPAPFSTVTHKRMLRMSRRPSFLARTELQKVEAEVEGQLSYPSDGIVQTRVPISKESGHLPQLRLALKVSHEGLVMVHGIVLFLETSVRTVVASQQDIVKERAIVISRNFEKIIEPAKEWVDLTQFLEDAIVYGVPETFSTEFHEITHTLIAQFAISPAHKPGRTCYLEVAGGARVLSEATVESPPVRQAPPPYRRTHTYTELPPA